METHNGCEVDPGETAVVLGLTEMVDKFNNIPRGTTGRHSALHPLSPARLSLQLLQPTPTQNCPYLATPSTPLHP